MLTMVKVPERELTSLVRQTTYCFKAVEYWSETSHSSVCPPRYSNTHM